MGYYYLVHINDCDPQGTFRWVLCYWATKLHHHINNNTGNATACEKPPCPSKARRSKKCDKPITGSFIIRNSKITFYKGLLYLLSHLQCLRNTYTVTYAIMFDHLIHCDCQVTAVLEKALHIAFWLNSDVPWHSVYFAKATSFCKQLHSRSYFPITKGILNK